MNITAVIITMMVVLASNAAFYMIGYYRARQEDYKLLREIDDLLEEAKRRMIEAKAAAMEQEDGNE